MKPVLIVVGLGNPGSSYERTRHNTGFRAVDALSEAYGEGEWKDSRKFLSKVKEGRIVTFPILFAKPQVFMNRSGEAVRKFVDFYKVDPKEQLLVLCDDVDLPLGDVRLRTNGSPGTHNGLKSIIEQFGQEFPRLRIGVGKQPPGADLAAWILSVPSAAEERSLEDALKKLPDIVHSFVLEGPTNITA